MVISSWMYNCVPVDDLDECSGLTNNEQLGLHDVTAFAVVDSAEYPPACSLDTTSEYGGLALVFNSMSSASACSEQRPCICRYEDV